MSIIQTAPTQFADVLRLSLLLPREGFPVFVQQSSSGTTRVSTHFPYLTPWPNPTAAVPGGVLSQVAGPSFDYWFKATGAASYSVSSGALPPGLYLNATSGLLRGFVEAPGTYTFTVDAINPIGSITSPTQTIVATYQPTLLGTPIVGRAMRYTIVGLAEAIVSQQWYRNDGIAGPVIIAGATGATYTPLTADIGYWLSVRVVTTSGTWSSIEFPAKNTILSQTAVQTGNSPCANLPSVTRVNSAWTFLAPMAVRTGYTINNVYQNTYIDTTFAPGTYVGFAHFGNPGGTATEATTYALSQRNLGTTAVIAARTFPTTATRPAGNTGTANFFTAGGALYDGNGNRFQIRGINKLHADSGTPGLQQSGTTSVRLWLETGQPFTTHNKPLLDAYIAAKIVPKVCLSGVYVKFTATFDGTTTMNVTATTVPGNLGYLYTGMAIGGTGTGIPACTIVSCPGGAKFGKIGVYVVSVAVPAGTVANLGTNYKASGGSNVNQLAAMAQMWADLYPSLAPYDDKILLNVANEWGPQASASNTIWRDAYVAAVPVIRGSGYKCPIVVDAGGSGQDTGGTTYALLNHARAIQDADPQKNIIGSLHIYGRWFSSGSHVPTIVALAAKSADPVNGGVPYVIGEFGPGRNVDVTNVNGGMTKPLEVMSTAEGLGLSGWYYWAWDDNLYTLPIREQDNWYSCVYNTSNGYSTKNAADLTVAGTDVVLDSMYGTSTAVPATIFP